MADEGEIVLGPLDQVPEDGMQQFHIDGKTVLVCRSGDAVHAVEGLCPHRGAQLGSGVFDGKAVICPWHDWAFDVESGCGLTNPISKLAKYKIRIRDGMIVLLMPAE